MAYPESRSLEDRCSYGAEVGRLRLASSWLKYADSSLHFMPRMITTAQHCAQALDQRSHLAVQQPWLQILEEVQRAQERVDLSGAEPESGQFVARSRAQLAQAIAVR